MKKITATDRQIEAAAILIAEGGTDILRIWALKRMATRFTKFDVTWKEAYALSFLIRATGTWFRQGSQHAEYVRERTTV